MGIVQYNDFQSSVIWQSGAESGDFSAWDAVDSSSTGGVRVTSELSRGGSKSIKFIMEGGQKNDDDRRLGVFVHETDAVYQMGFYWSYWVYIPSAIDDMVSNGGFAIGGLKWYFLRYKWSYGARWRLYYSSSYGETRAYIHIGGHINSGYEPPQDGVDYNPPSDVHWYSDIIYGAWNHFQIYLKSATDNTGVWQAWVNDDLLGTISNQPTHPNAFLNPPQDANFFSQDNLCPHPQIMYYGDYDISEGYLYIDDAVIATEKVPENHLVVDESSG